MDNSGQSLPSDLKSAQKRFEEWRGTRTRRGRIPTDLWELAVSLAKRHGSYRVSKALRLSYRDLKRRVASAQHVLAPPDASFSFVELDPGRSFSFMECVVEFQEAGGSKMTIRLNRTRTEDLIALSKGFFGACR